MVKTVELENRWEPCPECRDGFPNYEGLITTSKGKFHAFSCTKKDCELYYRVEQGKGAFDLRRGMKLHLDSIYFERCDSCKRTRPVKIVNLRFVCVDC